MTKYRAGQRVRIEVEAELVGSESGGLYLMRGPVFFRASAATQPGLAAWVEDATITILSEPRPDEPTGLGAVVEASASDVADGKTLTWVRARTDRNQWRPSTEVYCDNSGFYRAWDSLIDPVVMSEGWTP